MELEVPEVWKWKGVTRCLFHRRKPGHGIESGWPGEFSWGMDVRLRAGHNRKGESIPLRCREVLEAVCAH